MSNRKIPMELTDRELYRRHFLDGCRTMSMGEVHMLMDALGEEWAEFLIVNIGRNGFLDEMIALYLRDGKIEEATEGVEKMKNFGIVGSKVVELAGKFDLTLPELLKKMKDLEKNGTASEDDFELLKLKRKLQVFL